MHGRIAFTLIAALSLASVATTACTAVSTPAPPPKQAAPPPITHATPSVDTATPITPPVVPSIAPPPPCPPPATAIPLTPGQYQGWTWSQPHDSAAVQQLRALVAAAKAHASVVPSRVAVPGFYVDQAGYYKVVTPIVADADALTVLAYWYALTRDTSAARAAANLLRGWAKLNTSIDTLNDAPLFMAEVGGSFAVDAQLLKPALNAGDQTWIRLWLARVLVPATRVTMSQHANNWYDWGAYVLAEAGAFSDSARWVALADSAIGHALDVQVAPDGSLPAEIARGAGAEVWYTYFALDPLVAALRVTRAAGGVDYTDTTRARGKKLRAAASHLLYLATAAPGLTEPRVQDPWPADLFTVLGAAYGDKAMQAYAAKKAPNSYLGHHYAWPFATLTTVAPPPSTCK